MDFIHVAGLPVHVNDHKRVIQRCGICGVKLIDTKDALKIPNEGMGAITKVWEVGSMVEEVERGDGQVEFKWIQRGTIDPYAASDRSCIALVED